ncbi:MATE family efflux transporter [Oscillibacter hominis]|nr:MATE family efflux transporter [Oscillibacter hominis]
MAGHGAVLMTEGPIWKRVLSFALPILLGNLFQQLYNVVDSLVVGNFTGKAALAAVSSSSHLILLLVGLISGIFIGAGVVIARYYGAGAEGQVSTAVHTTVAFALISGIALTVCGVGLTPSILRLMGTPENVLPDSILYFRIYFSGVLFMALYNTVNGILQAMGDSRHPLYYLITAAVLNAILDILFVAGLNWGVAGAGAATVIAQGFSAFLGLRHLMRVEGAHRLIPRNIHLNRPMLREILQMGLPSGLQSSIIALANTVMQSNINSFGEDAMAGCGSYMKIEGFAFLPVTTFALAMTTFISQNLGARQYDRARRGARFGMAASMLLSELIGMLIYFLSPYLIALFNSDSAVVAVGVAQARTMAPFYFLLAFTHSISGTLRGAGLAVVPMGVMVVCWCVIRVSYVTLILRFFNDIRCIFLGYPLTWSLSCIVLAIYFWKADWLHHFDRQAHSDGPQTPQKRDG